VALVAGTGIHEQRADAQFLMVRKSRDVADGDKLAAFHRPGASSRPTTHRLPNPLITDQSFRLEVNEKSFQKDIAGRGRLASSAMWRVHKAGLARGGSLENAWWWTTSTSQPEGLRFPDEFVRHKILDAPADLSLIGMPVIGQLTAVKSGHALNQQLVRKLSSSRRRGEVVQPRASRRAERPAREPAPVLALEEQVVA